MQQSKISIVIPAKNEAASLKTLLPSLLEQFSEAEIIVVDDGSSDATASLCQQHGIRCIRHLYSKGNGAAIKSGCRHADGEAIVFMDADGQHTADDIHALIHKYDLGFDLVIGARNAKSHAGIGRLIANTLYNRFASYMVNQTVPDLTSGFRMVSREKFMQFLHLYPNGFSYPTTSTLAFYRCGYTVGFIPITANKRLGKSHIRPLRDGVRFFLILFRIGTLFSPLKIFFPISITLFSTGLVYYLYTYISDGRFTNMGILLFITSVIVFLIGLISEQITFLTYLDKRNNTHLK